MPSPGTALILSFIVAAIFASMYAVAYRRESQQRKKASVKHPGVQNDGSKERGRFWAPNQKSIKWSKDIRPVINWEVLQSPEIQVCLPKDKDQAIWRYQRNANVSYKEARDVVEYAISYPDHVATPGSAHKSKGKPMTTLTEPPDTFDNPDWDTLLSPTLQACINKNKQDAIRRYVAVTQANFKTAQNAVEYYLNHRDEAASHIRIYLVTDEQEKMIRQMLNEYKRAEAIQIYQELSGADEAKAVSDIDALRKEIMIHERFENRDPRFDH